MSGRAEQEQLIRRTGGNVVAVASSQLLGKFATLAWLIVATRVLDQAAFGAFAFALALALLVGALVEWGFTPAMVQQASRDRAALNRTYTSAQVWQLILGLPAYALAVFVARDAIDTPDAGLILLATVVATAAETWCSTARSAASVLQRQGRVSVALTMQRALIAVCVVLAVVVGQNVQWLALGFLIGTGLGVPLHSLALRRVGIRLSREGLAVRSLRPLWSASHYIGLSGVVLMGLAKLDQVLLGVLADDAAVGAYAAAYRLLETTFFVVFALRAALFPVLAADPRARAVRAGLRGAWAVVCVAYVPYAVICLLAPAPVLGLLFGAPYDVTAATSLQWLSVVPVIFAGAFLFNVALLAMGRQKVILVSALTALVLGVIGDLILIPLYGPAGAAAATVLGYSAQMVVAAVALRADMGLPPLLPTLVLTLVAGAVLGVTMSVLPLGPALMLGVVLYVGCTFILIRLLAPDRLTEMSMVLPSAVGARLRRWSGRSGPSTGAGERDSND